MIPRGFLHERVNSIISFIAIFLKNNCISLVMLIFHFKKSIKCLRGRKKHAFGSLIATKSIYKKRQSTMKKNEKLSVLKLTFRFFRSFWLATSSRKHYFWTINNRIMRHATMMIRFKIGIFSKRGMPNCFFVTDLNTNLKNASSFLTANAWMSQDFNPT